MWANAYVGIPFVEGGRDRQGCDCWGLYRLVFHDITGIWLPSYDTVTSTAAIREVIGMQAANGEQWVPLPIDHANDLDCVLMRTVYRTEGGPFQAADIHVGCFVYPGHVLHIEKGIDAMLQQPVTLKHRISQVFRHRERIK